VKRAFAILLLLSSSTVRASPEDFVRAERAADERREAERARWAAVWAPRARTWPMTVELHALIGVEPHDQANADNQAVAFGVGGELLWRGRVGAFLSVLASQGSAVLVTKKDAANHTLPALADRISIPLGVALRPLAFLFRERTDYAAALAGGLGVQAGVSIENLRTSADDAWKPAGHIALTWDVPLYGSPIGGGVALRVAFRGLFSSETALSPASPSTAGGPLGPPQVVEPGAALQFFAGLSYVP
jgi:hypothetical protein